jgi:hypothetical protein
LWNGIADASYHSGIYLDFLGITHSLLLQRTVVVVAGIFNVVAGILLEFSTRGWNSGAIQKHSKSSP